MTTLVLTNDFPPRLGGIEAFVAQVCRLLDDDVVVLTSSTPGRGGDEARHDAAVPYPVHRLGPILLPTPATARTAADLMARHGAANVVFGAAAPLGLLASPLRAAGARRLVAISHGHEVWWARVPGTRSALRRIGADVDILTTLTDFTTAPIAAALAPRDRTKIVRLAPPVDLDSFVPQPRQPGPPTIVTAGRMVPRKNHTTLLRAFDRVRAHRRDARLLIAGDGPLETRLRRMAGPGVTFCGRLPHAAMPDFYAQGDVFASPVCVRPLDQEGFGMVFAEAAAAGLPVVVGRSGGAPETVRDGVSGHVLDPHDDAVWADMLLALLDDPARARRMGLAGRAHVMRFSASAARRILRDAMALP